jgi:hypothetical protein
MNTNTIATHNERDARQSLATITAGGLELFGDAQSVLRDTLGGLPIKALSAQKVAEFQGRLNELEK